MVFSNSKYMALRPKKEKYFATFFTALAVAAAFFVPYMIMGEGYFIFYGDFNVQQIPFYQECHAAIKSGEFFWNWHTDLGANFIGSYSFYLLGSPFFWLTIPFPNSFLPYLMGPLLILKFAFSALTAYCYIRRFTRTPETAMMGGLLYAFSGFSVYNIFFNHFHEAIIFFPLLLLSLELLITENRRFVFALMVCICAVTNYFFFFGMVVFTIIYFFVRLFSGAFKLKFSRFAVMIFEAVLGLALSAGLLLPSISAIIDNSRISSTLLGWSAIMYGKEQIYANVLQCFFFPPDIPARPVFFPEANVKWSSLGGWLPLFSTVGLFTFFSQRKGHWLKRVIGISIFMALVPFLNSAFYAFNTSYYARWFYMPILMLCLATVTLTEDKSVNWKSGYRWVLGITVATSAVIGFFPQKTSEDKLIFGLYSQGNGSFDDRLMYALRFWGACAIAITGLIVLRVLLRLVKNNRKTFVKSAICCICIFSVLYANVFIACGRSHSYEIKEVVIDSLIEGDINLNDSENFRVDCYDCVDNTAMYLGQSGINAFHSIVPASIMEFYDFIDVERSVGSRPDTDVYAIRPLLSVKYLLNRKDGNSFVDEESGETKMPGYTYLKTESGYYIYQNDNYVPYGFSYDYYMDYDFCDSYSSNDRAALMLKAILLTDEQIEKYGFMFENVSDLSYGGFYDQDETTLALNEDTMAFDCAKLKETSATEFSIDKKGFSATVSRDDSTLVFFSVPYDKGWTATVNGRPCEIEKVNVGFMAVKVDAGISEIRFDYTAPALLEGLKVTIGAAAIFLLYMLLCFVLERKLKPDTAYPEGETLIREWRKQEILEMKSEIADEAETLKKPSILDDIDNKTPKNTENSFGGGFKIDTDAFDDK